ncbi:MAG: NAD-dependent dehydratase [Anaerolineae bacterium]|nr:NAD-dependent dehydratase [Anaerolineae bacterium]
MSEFNVVFGSGPLAQSVVHALLRRGKQVRMINRSGSRPAGIPETVEILPGDAYQVEFTRQAARGAAVVYQCAQPPYHQWVEKFPALQAAILEGAAANGAKLIVGENLYMYGDTNGAVIHEGLPHAARTRKGRVRAEMSAALLEAHRAGRVQVAMGRGADFYGPAVLGSMLGERAILPLLQGKPAEVVGALDLPHTYTYIGDFGEALAILGERQEALGKAWHVPNPPTLTQRQLLTLFFNEAGLPPRFSVMSRLMMAFGGLFIPAARESVEMMYEFEKPFVVDSSPFIQTFGDIATPHEQAVKATLAWYRQWMADGAHGAAR